MKKLQIIALFLSLGFLFSCTIEKYRVETHTDKNGFKYETVSNDPMKARIYTLDNGLKIYLSENKDEPRIATLIGIRAGSTSDPIETTGLAHYFEHMMFKGTSKIGALNWEVEEPLLQEISDLFEKRRSTDDTEEKMSIYKKIDSLSAIAAEYVAANEYDKMVSSIGAKNTNAGTSYDFTIYINDIPVNEFEKWVMLESERFSDMVLRLFHTELETVYEEYNMYQDMDYSRADIALMKALFPNHPYGRQVIGLAEHIKNPSMVNIYKFAETFYVPNNMAIALAGDIDFENTIQLIDKYFGKHKSRELPEIKQPVEEPIKEPIVKEVVGPEAENLIMAFRFDGDNSEDHKYITLIDMILSNRQAGLIDLNLVQQQKVLKAGCYANFMKDYGIHEFFGTPREGQTLEEVKNLLLEQIELVKKGEFEDWMIESVINDLRLTEIYRLERNFSRAFSYLDAFIKNIPYVDKLRFIDELEKITKDDLIKFANEKYKDNYAIVYKLTGETPRLSRVEKPPITPVPINREYQSEFYKEFSTIEPEQIKPVFVDFEKEISTKEINSDVKMYYIRNNTNEIFSLNYIIDMGKNHNKKFPLAVNYLPYLGTDKYTPAELQQEFFRLGLNFGVNARNERSYVYISGLNKSFKKGIELLEHVIANAKPDKKAYDDYVDGILKEREDNKLSKNTILWRGMLNYGIYGKKSPFTNIIPKEELLKISPDELTQLIKEITTYKHKIFYYGPEDIEASMAGIKSYHKLPESMSEIPEPEKFIQQDNKENVVYFVNYDMLQANIIMISKAAPFDINLIPPSRLFGEYFGGGLSSIVFQEIRESKALAYSAFASFSVPGKPDRNNILYGFVGTQADKLKNATDAMLELMNDMPKAQKQFSLAKESIIKKINTERIIKSNIFWTYMRNLDRGINYDIRKDVYKYMQSTDINQFEDFFNKNIKGKKYNFLVLGNKELLNMNTLKNIGKIHELSLEEIFNY